MTAEGIDNESSVFSGVTLAGGSFGSADGRSASKRQLSATQTAGAVSNLRGLPDFLSLQQSAGGFARYLEYWRMPESPQWRHDAARPLFHHPGQDLWLMNLRMRGPICRSSRVMPINSRLFPQRHRASRPHPRRRNLLFLPPTRPSR